MATTVQKAANPALSDGRSQSWLELIERRSLISSMLLGMFAALSLPPLYILPGLLGFAGWLWFSMKVTSRRSAFLTGWSFGLGYFIVGLYWIAIAFFTDAEKFGALAVPAIILLSAVMAVFPGFAGLALGLLRPRHPVAAAFALAMAWAIAEWLRAHFLWGFPWNLIGYVWIGVLPMSQIAAWIGIYGLGVLTVLIGALFITVLTFAGNLRWAGPASSIAMIALLGAGGMARLAGGDVEHQPDVHLRLVQANIAQHHKWDPELRAESFRQHLAQTTGPEARPTTHVIWPETASAYILDEDEGARTAIADATPPDGFLITGFNRFDFESEPKRAWNSLAAIDSEGTIASIYDKQRLVPFGEFLPWRHILSLIGLKKITAGTVDFQPGPGPTTMRLDGLPPFSPLICMARLAGGDVEHQPDVHLRLVQANIAQHHKWDPELRAESFRQHLAQTISPEARPATHVIWPETASAYILDEDEGARTAIADATPPDGFVITGFNRFDFESEPKRAWNSLAAIDSEGTIASIYDKQRLVPFGEFLPWRHILSLIGLKKITAGTVDFQPGPGPTTMRLDGLPPFSPLICYEVIFTGDVVNPNDRPAWLLNITNDAWFGQSTGPYQHLAMARMRAIEEGLPLARSANTGISAVVDPFGRIEVMLGLGESGVLDAPLPKPLSQPTFYAVWGQTVFLLMVVVGVVIIFMIEKLFKN